MFVLTQLPTFPQLLISFARKDIVPGLKVAGLSAWTLSWSGSGSGPQLVWFWTGSGLVAAWLPRVTGHDLLCGAYPVTSGRPLWTGSSVVKYASKAN